MFTARSLDADDCDLDSCLVARHYGRSWDLAAMSGNPSPIGTLMSRRTPDVGDGESVYPGWNGRRIGPTLLPLSAPFHTHAGPEYSGCSHRGALMQCRKECLIAMLWNAGYLIYFGIAKVHPGSTLSGRRMPEG